METRWVAALAAMGVAASIAAMAAGTAVGIPTHKVYAGYVTAILLLAPPTLILGATAMLVRAMLMRVASPIAACKPFLADRFGSFDGAAGTLGPVLLMPVLMGAFGTLKQMMPLIAPFAWDDRFAALDRALFLGHQPWQLTHAILGSPGATLVVDHIYTGWVALLFVAVLGFAILGSRELRARFFLSFGAGWLLIGVVGAFLFASAGPCYTDAIGAASAGDYAGLMQRLHAIDAINPLGAVEWQGELWSAHAEHRYGFAMGVSAMPSMHNAITFLYVLCALRAAPWVRIGTMVFAVVILFGSVHLGWHYLVDGLFAWAMMAAIWCGAGAYLRRSGYAVAVAGERGPVADPDADEDLPGLLPA